MKFNPIPLITVCLLVSFSALSQDDSRYLLRLQSGAFIPEKNITTEKISVINQRAVASSGKSFVVIQFDQLPSENDKERLRQAGIELLDYIPANSYTAIVSGSLRADVLQQNKARAIVPMTASMKMHPALLGTTLPAYAVKVIGTVDVWISFPKAFSFEEVSAELTKRNFDINNIVLNRYRIIGLRVAEQRLQELASLPFIDYMQAAPPEDKSLNDKSTSNARANVITSSLGRNLSGEGVVIGIGDNGDPSTHPDFSGRYINRHAGGAGAHGLHVMGTAAGAGIMNEKYAGFAPKATIVSQLNSGILHSLPAYVQDHGMVITNNSYGLIVDDCNNFGAYDLYSRLLDQQAFDMPNLENVFAAGNSGLFGLTNCAYYANGYGTVLSGYQSAKNTVVVGNTTENDSLHYVSSRGPVRDGRIKPDITAQGRNVWSAGFGSYWSNTGTSMSSPAVAGGLALLYQRYRQLNGNSNPPNALMKALLLNGATDLGTDGPDYAYGFGWMNLLRSVIMMENNTYYNATIANGGTNDQAISVPANTAMLKVMLYWNDPSASPLAQPALVNDLDLEVIRISPSATFLPFILDTLPANILNPATTGVDHINNVEQVVIQNPVAGNYTIRVKGTSVTQNPPQQFFVVYDTIPVSTTLTYPMGREKFLPGDSVYITWDSWGGPVGTYTLEYNNGSGWSTISTTVHDTLRQYKFFIPNTDTTDAAQIRITDNGTGMVSTSNNFTILGLPTIGLNHPNTQCEGYIAMNWFKVPKATDYEVMILQGSEMIPVAITTDTFYTYKGLSKDSLYWVTVRPRLNGNPGRRAQALSRQPNNGLCMGTISDNDIKLDSITSPPTSGRLLTSNALLAAHPVVVRIKNLDDVVATGPITFTYTLNGGGPVSETVSPTINAGDVYTHTFATTANLLAAGNYDFIVTVTKAGDPLLTNNTATRSVKQLNNPAITLGSLPFLDDFESAPAQTVNVRQVGLNGRDRYDFVNSMLNGRVRTFLNTGIAYSGIKALTLDVDRLTGAPGNIDSLTGTFNLAAFDTSTHDLRLEFKYKNHGQLAHAANKVWIRGADTSQWLPVYDLYANQLPADGSYKVAGIRVSDSLKAHLQNFSTSFQLRFGQAGNFVAADNDHRAGYTFDDILLYRVVDDIEMIRIDTPSTTGCNLGSAEPVRITLRNTANTPIVNVPVVLKVDGNIIVSENAGPLGPGATVTYTFTTGFANLAAMGAHTIEVYANVGTDSYRTNDTVRIAVTNSPVLNTFPYLENFELGTGSWFTSGKNSSWQYGTPNGIYINRAASGSKAWKTGGGYYNDKEESYLYSPCFDISGMTNPTLSLSRALNIEECAGGLCDGAWVEYSLDGKAWTKLGAQGQGTNWYNRTYAGDGSVWSDQDTARWKCATIPLPTTSNSRLRLRFVMSADQELNKEGIGVDDIHIYDNTNGIYDGATMGAPVTQTISGGTGWINFTSGGKLVASIQPNNQNMGVTDVQAYINTAPLRFYNGQYYHDRNITIKPANIALADSVTVRFYFLDSETERLIGGSGCPICYKPRMAYDLGVSKYSDPNDALEDGSVLNDNPGLGWTFINAAKAVKVPFDKGYYAEFKVKNFSEFWLNNGGFDNNHPLPVQLLTFNANKSINQKDVLATWKTGSEISVDRFEIEVAKGNDELRRNNFIKIGEMQSRGNGGQGADYNFTDAEPNKSGARYYRLKIVDNDGSFAYSAVRPVLFTTDVKWQVYPNPSKGMFSLLYQLNDGEKMRVKIYDAAGKTVYQNTFVSGGFMQKTDIDLRSPAFAAGLYLMEAESENGKQSFKLLKQ